MVLAAKEKDADGNERLVFSAVAADIAAGLRVAVHAALRIIASSRYGLTGKMCCG